jgi:uncharacterized protein YegL
MTVIRSLNTPTDTRVKTLHVAIILDRSGSMEDCRDATISGFNELVEGIRADDRKGGLRTRITLVTFNHEVEVVQFKAPLSSLHRISRETYVPGGNTAMLDAVGLTLDRLTAEVKDQASKSFLVCIVSDGYENASRRYTYPDIAARIRKLTEAGNWTVTYLGSNQDLSKVSEALHIPAGNVAAYAATPAGTNAAWTVQREATTRRMARVRSGQPAAAPFYEEDERDTTR